MPFDGTAPEFWPPNNMVNVEAFSQLKRVLRDVRRHWLTRRLDMRVVFDPAPVGGWRACRCALGWAMQDEWFLQHGLRGRSAFNNAMDLFGITHDELVWLFFWWEGAGSVGRVIRRIDRFLADRGLRAD